MERKLRKALQQYVYRDSIFDGCNPPVKMFIATEDVLRISRCMGNYQSVSRGYLMLADE